MFPVMATDERTYLPAEAEILTGWSCEQQRDLRKQGYIEKSGSRGWTRFDLLAICRLTLLHVFQDAGLSLREAARVAPAFQDQIAGIALGYDPWVAVIFRAAGEIYGCHAATPASLLVDLRLMEMTGAGGAVDLPLPVGVGRGSCRAGPGARPTAR